MRHTGFRSSGTTESEADRLRREWTWPAVYSTWLQRFNDFAPWPRSIFQILPVVDDARTSGRPPSRSWWPTERLKELHLEFQRHLDQYPGTNGPVDPAPGSVSKGEQQTLEYLHEVKDDPEALCAVLFAASLFPRTDSTRGRFPHENWPSYECVTHLQDLADSKRGRLRFDEGWHYSSTKALPFRSNDRDYRISEMAGLIRYIAEEHAVVLLSYTPVEISFVATRDPFIGKVLQQESEERAAKQERWRVEALARRSVELANEQEVNKLHPRRHEWQAIDAKQLESLVWSKPTIELAKEFGVSDVAIGKKCTSLGVTKPPPGFWNKVRAGKLAHPGGVPVGSKPTSSD